MKKNKVITTTIDVISALLVLLFIYAALTKLSDIQKFQIEIGKSPLLNSFSKPVSIGIPLVEILISVLFFFKKFQLYALYLSFTLLVIFTTYIIIILNYSSYIPCSCGGVLQKMSWSQHILFNLGFTSLIVLGVILYPTKTLSADKRGIPKTLSRVGN